MYKQREEIDETIKAELTRMRNTHDTLSLVETDEFTATKLIIPYLNGQAGVCQTTLMSDNLTPEERFNTLLKLTAYQICMLQYIEFPNPEEPTEETQPKTDPILQ